MQWAIQWASDIKHNFHFNWLQFIISISLLPATSDAGGKKSSGSATLGSIKILRVFRVLRPLRAINRAKGLKVISFVFHLLTFLTKTKEQNKNKTNTYKIS